MNLYSSFLQKNLTAINTSRSNTVHLHCMLQAMLFAFGERKCLMMGATRETLTNYKFIALMNSHNITFIRSLKMISMK